MDKSVRSVYYCLLFSYDREPPRDYKIWFNPFFQEPSISKRANLVINREYVGKEHTYHYIYRYKANKTITQRLRYWLINKIHARGYWING